MEDKGLEAIYAKRNSDIKRQMYAEKADPLFFKWQRGLATQEEWLLAVQEIDNVDLSISEKPKRRKKSDVSSASSA